MNQKLIKSEAYKEYGIVSNAMTNEYYDYVNDCDKCSVFFDGGLSQWTED
jgi:hypothetical protein